MEKTSHINATRIWMFKETILITHSKSTACNPTMPFLQCRIVSFSCSIIHCPIWMVYQISKQCYQEIHRPKMEKIILSIHDSCIICQSRFQWTEFHTHLYVLKCFTIWLQFFHMFLKSLKHTSRKTAMPGRKKFGGTLNMAWLNDISWKISRDPTDGLASKEGHRISIPFWRHPLNILDVL